MDSKLMLLCGLMLIFCVTAISAELVAYPYVGCFTAASIRRYFSHKLPLSGSQKGEDDVMRCFKAARAKNYHIFAIREHRKKGVQCWTGKDAEEHLKTFQEGSGCKNGLGGQNVFDVYLVPGGETESCQGLPDGEYQDSLFCNRFYTCMDGKATVKLCSRGLLFDPATRQCLDKVPCPHGEPCRYHDDGEYPHPTSCQKYLVCYNHQAFEASCPSHLWFNDDTKECDSPGNTKCSNDPCEDSTCLNGGTCMATQEEVSQFKCVCKAGFTGTRCEAKNNPCSLHPCKNGGTCQELGNNTYVCKCELGYGGQNCTVKVEPCSLHPCKNGGTCQELGDNTYVCKCELGYGGQNCAEKTDFESSRILSHNEGLLKILLEYLKDVQPNGEHWKRCYSAIDHDYVALAFHDHCNNKGPTVTLVEAGSYVFGGYTDQAWTSIRGHIRSTDSFLFSLRGSKNEPFKSPLFRNYYNAIYDHPGYGPSFGTGPDLRLSDNCHTSKTSYSRLGDAYKVPSGYTANTALAGSEYFYCDDYEVFYLA